MRKKKSEVVWIGLRDTARRFVGWSTMVDMGNYAYIRVGDGEFGLREWTDNARQEVWREVVQDVDYDLTGTPIVWTCVEKYGPSRVREYQWGTM